MMISKDRSTRPNPPSIRICPFSAILRCSSMETKGLDIPFSCWRVNGNQRSPKYQSTNFYSCFIIVEIMEQQQQPKIYGHINDICMIGHGSIGTGALPLIMRHFTYDHFTIIDPHPVKDPEPSDRYTFLKIEITRENLKETLDKIFVNKLGFLVNLSFGISSTDLTNYCQEKGVLYIDTGKIEWIEFYLNRNQEPWKISNYWVREMLLRDVRKHNRKPTAVSACGANPGMVSFFVKKALMDIARDTGYQMEHEPKTKAEWGLLMKNLGVKGVHVAERDTQRSNEFRGEKEFWNTWSTEAFIAEGSLLPSELGWGTHEKWMPKEAHHYPEGCQSGIYMDSPGMNVLVKSWCPTYGPQFGFLITHDESISISDFFTVREGDKVVFRPTVHYAYHPAPDAVASAFEAMGTGDDIEGLKHRILEKEIVTGMDELGVLVYGHAKNAYWYGSQLDIESTRKRAPNQNATALQVTSAVIAGMVWALENPEAGLVECDEMDYKRCLEVMEEYISPVRGYYTDWTPLHNTRHDLRKEDYDREDPWQFKNVVLHK